MKIAVVGCGALGSFYGTALLGSGADVHFLLRSDFATVRREGVRILGPAGERRFRPGCATRPEDIGVCDLVVIGLKTTANHEFGRLLPPLVGADTCLLTLQNGLGNEEQLAQHFCASRVLGGLCFVCLNRTAPGVIEHIAHGRVVLGEFQRPPWPRTWAIAELFRRGGVPCDLAENLERAHWDKLTWNVPFNGLGVASAAGYEALTAGHAAPAIRRREACRTTDRLLGEPRWEQLVRELMREVIATGNALGLQLPASLEEEQIARTRVMGPYRASTLIDFERGQALELKSLFLKPLEAARRARVETPRLRQLCRVLEALDPARESPGD